MSTPLVRRTVAGTALALAALGLAGCGGSSSSTASPPATSPSHSMSSSMSMSPSGSTSSSAEPMITIKNYAYSGPSSVKPGSTVMVMNDDSVAHTLTASGKGGFDLKIDPGKSATFTAPSKPGSYPYICDYHSNMHGTLTVR